MNSDDGSTGFSSDSSFGNDLMETQRIQDVIGAVPTTPTTPKASKLRGSWAALSPHTPCGAKKHTAPDAKEQHVLSVVRRCLDESKEDIDLSGLQLDSLPLEVREISTMVKDEPALQVHFDSLVARPRLYLSNNILRQLPSPILELSNLRLLSLRQNKLARLPPGIRNLTKLETFNISGNKLRTLPGEVLDLMVNHRLTELLSEPNPWITHTEEQKKARLRNSRLSSRPKLHTMVKDPRRSDDDYHLILRQAATSEYQNMEQMDCFSRRVPPLSELVHRQLSKLNTPKKDLSPLLAEDAPVSVTKTLKDLHSAQIDGDRRCSWCKRLYVMPAQTWIEWWDVGLVKKDRIETPLHSLDDAFEPGFRTGSHVLPFEIGICGGCA